MKMNAAFENFILSRQLMDLSPKTIIAYTDFVRPFVAFIGPEEELLQVTQNDISRYIKTLLERPISRSTRATYIRHVKIFLKWSEKEYEVNYKSKDIKVPKSPKKNVKLYSDDELCMIFDSISASETWIILRNRCIIALMYDSGLRQSEICNLRYSRISFSQRYMTVLGKGNKERTVPLGSLAIDFLNQYRHLCPYDSDNVFLTRTGSPISCNTIKLMVSKLAKKLPFELSSHKLRHNFATNYCLDQYDQTGQIDIYKLKYLMGHENIETTERYLHFAYEIIASRNTISHLDRMRGRI